ncbi:MAG: CDP-alcohol phosphatidyltransferase family protein [Dehalococcoidia bacterium]|nr:MAG: CDP-alcohol phosphatidyltransferase family protein [Dehalococcoidia bacterium]
MSDPNWRRSISVRFTTPVARLLAHMPFTPDFLTWLGFLLACGAAALVAAHHLLWGGIGVLVAGLMDTFDGALARQTRRVSRFGAVLDSTLDRLSEGVVLLGVIFVFARDGSAPGAVLAGAALIFSFSVSYIRARAEGMGVACSEGWFTRTERVIVIALGLIFNQLIIALSVVSALSLITAAQRLFIVWRKLRPEK